MNGCPETRWWTKQGSFAFLKQNQIKTLEMVGELQLGFNQNPPRADALGTPSWPTEFALVISRSREAAGAQNWEGERERRLLLAGASGGLELADKLHRGQPCSPLTHLGLPEESTK